MSIDITELDASLTLRNLSKEEKRAVIRLMELSIIETKAAMQARIEKLEAHMQEAIDNCETCHGSVDCARCKTFEADLKGE